MSIYRRVFSYYRPFLRPSLSATALTLLLIPFNLLKPWPFAYIVGQVLPAADQPDRSVKLFGRVFTDISISETVGALCILMVAVHLIAGWLNLMAVMIYVRIGLQGLLRLRTELYAYLHSLPLKFHDQRRSADSSFRVAYDSQALQTFYAKATFIFQAGVTLASTFAAMFWLDWRLTLISLLVIPMMIGVFRLFARRIRSEATQIAERESDVLQQVQEGLSSIRMVQAFGREDHEVRQFQSSARRSL